MEEFLEWFELRTLGFCFIAYAVSKWCFFLSMYIRRNKGEDNTFAFLLSMLGMISSFLALPVIIVTGIPDYYITKYLGDSKYQEGKKIGEQLGYILGKADERRDHGWDD
jgi:hypothetical protein